MAGSKKLMYLSFIQHFQFNDLDFCRRAEGKL
jgi:hypothetical protein